jgi:hypothetical protein
MEKIHDIPDIKYGSDFRPSESFKRRSECGKLLSGKWQIFSNVMNMASTSK